MPAGSFFHGRIGRLFVCIFSATSAVCVTGLSVLEIGTAFSLFGQMVMLILIQLGGIGFMTATSMVYMLIGRRITLKDRIVIK